MKGGRWPPSEHKGVLGTRGGGTAQGLGGGILFPSSFTWSWLDSSVTPGERHHHQPLGSLIFAKEAFLVSQALGLWVWPRWQTPTFRNSLLHSGWSHSPGSTLSTSPWKPRGAHRQLPATHAHGVPGVLAEAGQIPATQDVGLKPWNNHVTSSHHGSHLMQRTTLQGPACTAQMSHRNTHQEVSRQTFIKHLLCTGPYAGR